MCIRIRKAQLKQCFCWSTGNWHNKYDSSETNSTYMYNVHIIYMPHLITHGKAKSNENISC